MGNDVYIWEIAQVFEKWLNYVGKWLKYLENGLDIWGTAKVF